MNAVLDNFDLVLRAFGYTVFLFLVSAVISMALGTLLAATAVVLLAIGARVYEGSLLRTNGRTSFATAWKSRSLVS